MSGWVAMPVTTLFTMKVVVVAEKMLTFTEIFVRNTSFAKACRLSPKVVSSLVVGDRVVTKLTGGTLVATVGIARYVIRDNAVSISGTLTYASISVAG